MSAANDPIMRPAAPSNVSPDTASSRSYYHAQRRTLAGARGPGDPMGRAYRYVLPQLTVPASDFVYRIFGGDAAPRASGACHNRFNPKFWLVMTLPAEM